MINRIIQNMTYLFIVKNYIIANIDIIMVIYYGCYNVMLA